MKRLALWKWMVPLVLLMGVHASSESAPSEPDLKEAVASKVGTVPKIKRKPSPRFYATLGLGAVRARGMDKTKWNTWLMSVRLGARLAGNLQIELGLDHFLYNAWVGILKYQITSDSRSVGAFVGIGAANVTQRITFEGSTSGVLIDPRPDFQLAGLYGMPTLGVSWPFFGTSLKVESFILVNSTRYVAGAMCGVISRF